ncbi:hypothetical protein AB0M95_10275 [Sphaerisporangium sp. NPDC051017]
MPDDHDDQPAVTRFDRKIEDLGPLPDRGLLPGKILDHRDR